MKDLNWLIFNTWCLGIWTFAWILTIFRVIPFNWIILLSGCNLVAFIMFYKDVSSKNANTEEKQ